MPELSEAVRQHVRYRTIHDDREHAAAVARKAQSAYRKYTRAVVLSTLGAAVCGGLVLYSVDLEKAPANPHMLHVLDESPWQQILIVAQALCLAAAAFSGYKLSFLELKATWRRERMEAEHLRLERERIALELSHEESPESFRIAGEQFLEFIEEQRDFFKRRQSVAQQRRGQLALVGGLAAGLTAACAVLLGMESVLVLAFVGLVGVMAPALTSAVQSWAEATSENDRTKLHRHTAIELGKLLEQSSEFETTINEHDLPNSMVFAEKVFAQLRKDHSGFASILKQQENEDQVGGDR